MENKNYDPIDHSWNLSSSNQEGIEPLDMFSNSPNISKPHTPTVILNLPDQTTIPATIQSNTITPTRDSLIIHKPNSLIGIIKTILVFMMSFCFIYLFLTFPAQFTRLKYFIKHIRGNNQPQIVELPKDFNSNQDLLLSTIKDALEKSPDQVKELEKKYSINISNLENNSLIIPKIEIKAPIIWNVAPDEKIMLNKLQNGLVHYNGTSLPDEKTGNVFISGHSSYYWWDKGNYKTIFANLDKLTNGDELAMAYQGKIYIYRIYDKKVVKPNQVEVLQPTNLPIITLMTCTPVGTSLNRLVISGERLDIVNQNNSDSSSTQSTPSTPKPTPAGSSIEKNPLELLPWF